MAIRFTAADQPKSSPAAPASKPAEKAEERSPAIAAGIEPAAGTDLFDSTPGAKTGKRKRK